MKADLTETVNRLLGPNTSFSRKMALLDRAEEELLDQQGEYRELYKHLPEEGKKLEDAFNHYTRLLDNFRELLSTQETPQERIDELLDALKSLKGLQFDFHETLWASRGPSTHPGLNQLLALLQSDDEEAIYSHIKSEGKRVEAQDQVLAKQPSFLRQPLESLIDEYYELLRDLIEVIDEGTLAEEREDLEDKLRVWADEYSCHDLEGLRQKYSAHPTVIPDINFCLNVRRLYLEEYVSGHLFDHVFENTMSELQNVMTWVEKDPDIQLLEKSQYKREHTKVVQLVDDIARAKSLDSLKEVGQACVSPCEALDAWQKRFSKT